MNFFELIETAFRNLYQRKARTILTILGVIIGTMSITLMISIGIGSRQQFDENFTQNQDLTKIEVYTSGMGQETTLNQQLVVQIESDERVKAVLPYRSTSVYLRSTKYVTETALYAVPFDVLEELYSDKLEWGKIEKSKDVRLIVGGDTAEYDFHLRQPGQQDIWAMPMASGIDFENIRWDFYYGGTWYYGENAAEALPEGVVAPPKQNAVVTGAFTTSNDMSYGIYMDMDVFERAMRQHKPFFEEIVWNKDYERLSVYANDVKHVLELETMLKDWGYEAYSPMTWIEEMQKESERQQLLWGVVGAIALLVSAIGIANTMLTSIMERRREIGILKVLGCSLLRINMMFLVEAAAIGLLGGAVGVGLSYALAAVLRIDSIGGTFGESVRFVITPGLAIGALFGAAIIGMIAGLYPAYRATRMSPLDALRNE
ncbi:MAG: ABC transporter permease [Christensenellaceae bacterium]|jgi:putative ABC transport system permease protein